MKSMSLQCSVNLPYRQKCPVLHVFFSSPTTLLLSELLIAAQLMNLMLQLMNLIPELPELLQLMNLMLQLLTAAQLMTAAQ